MRWELAAFVSAIDRGESAPRMDENLCRAISRVMEDFRSGKDCTKI